MRRPLLLLACGMVLVARSVSAAQIFEVPVSAVLQLDPSTRSYAMASATGAVFWGKDPNHWLNPALLGYAEGIRYDDALQDFAFTVGTPGFEEELHIRQTARGETIGYGGLGVALAGQPFEGLGGRSLDFADFDDQARSWRVGISLARIAQSVLPGRGPGIIRHFDLAFGYGETTIDGELADNNAVCWDWGLLARGGTEFTVRGVPAQVEGAYGYSFLNRGDDRVFGNQHELNSTGLHVAAARLPDGFAGFPSWLRTGFEPLVSIGGGFSAVYYPWDAQHVERWGGELGLANVLFLRLGSAARSGYGIGLPVGTLGGVRYDRAFVDNGADIKYRAWSVWIDPLAIARAGR